MLKATSKHIELCNTPSDIYMHLPKLKEYAEKCDHITEFGFRNGVSTYSLLAGFPEKLISYDIVNDPEAEKVLELAIDSDVKFLFIHKNVLEVEIEPTELLFIDTWHTGSQVAQELNMHADKVSKYLIFHDVQVNWQIGEDGNPENGLRYGIEPFMAAHPEWEEIYRTEENHGLLILERC